jgi:beta-galactosidase
MSGPHKLHLDRRQMIKGSAGFTAVLASGTASAASPVRTRHGRQPESFDQGWRFLRGDGENLQAPGLDDSDWRPVDLPHDWSIEDLPAQPSASSTIIGPFDKNAPAGGSTGFAVGGDGWYRKHFRVDLPTGGRAEILFDGAYMNSELWLNGHRLGGHFEGYTPFAFDLTPHLSPGDNVIAVHVRNRGKNSRWYTGSGIYRHVWLDLFPDQARIARWGIGISTLRLASGRAEIEIKTKLVDLAPGLTVLSRIRDRDGQIVWEGRAAAAAELHQRARIRGPRLWSPESPSLYVLETELRRGATIVDHNVTSFGVRLVSFDIRQGMLLNGQSIKLRGGCVHADNGLLGAAAFDGAEDRKVRLLRARGFNAVRPSHNLFSPAFLDACDRHGMMVVCDTFDCWEIGKNPDDYAKRFKSDWQEDLRRIVESARHHPSIIMWSIGNEVPGRNAPEGLRWQWELANEVHRLDPTRPVTAALNNFVGREVAPSPKSARVGSDGQPDHASSVFLDIVGYNYKLKDYGGDHRLHPQRIFLGTESYPKDVFDVWELTDRTPWLLGDFVWTAMDYLGEAGIGGSSYEIPGQSGPSWSSPWPMVNAFCGDLDLIGQRKAPSFARDVVWSLSPLEIAVQAPPPEGKVEIIRTWGWSDEMQSWTWPGSEGRPMAVRIYTSGDRVEMRLNGKSVATRAVTAADVKHVELSVEYAPGVLEVIAFRDGKVIGRRNLTTVGRPERLRLVPESPSGGSGRGDVSYVMIEVVDAQGRLVPDAAVSLQLDISGPGELAAFGSAAPFAVGSFQSSTSSTWRGRALAIIRGRGNPGTVTITAKAPLLGQATTSLSLV